jgi:hypothetical protein
MTNNCKLHSNNTKSNFNNTKIKIASDVIQSREIDLNIMQLHPQRCNFNQILKNNIDTNSNAELLPAAATNFENVSITNCKMEHDAYTCCDNESQLAIRMNRQLQKNTHTEDEDGLSNCSLFSAAIPFQRTLNVAAPIFEYKPTTTTATTGTVFAAQCDVQPSQNPNSPIAQPTSPLSSIRSHMLLSIHAPINRTLPSPTTANTKQKLYKTEIVSQMFHIMSNIVFTATVYVWYVCKVSKLETEWLLLLWP